MTAITPSINDWVVQNSEGVEDSSCFLSKDATQININIFCRCKVSSFLNKVKIFPKRAPDLLALERLMSVSLVQVCLELSIFIILAQTFKLTSKVSFRPLLALS